MSRLGQCPSCQAMYEVSDDDLGQLMQCECGATLFICDVAGFSEIPVGCAQCGGQYVVDREGAGEAVECECGENLSVPTVVLRSPVAGGKGVDPKKLLVQQKREQSAATEAGNDIDEKTVACPACKKQYSATPDDVGDQAQCRCGCVFVITTRPDGKLVARRKKAGFRSDDDHGDEDHESSPARRKRPMSLLSILGLAAVGLLLLVSIIMFVTRDSRRAVAAKEEQPTVTIKPPVAQAGRRLPGISTAEQLPAASSDRGAAADSFRAPVMTPPGQDAASSHRPPRPIPAPDGDSDDDAAAMKGKESWLAPPPEVTLPKPKAARPVVPIVPARQQGLTLERAYTEAFQAYSKTSELKKEAGESGDPSAYHRQLGITIGLLKQTLELATRQNAKDRVDELRYLLTYLSYSAGRLPEAAILGEAVARWGEKDTPATLEAAMIALAATQEANETQWGDRRDSGELEQMESIAQIIAQRWPDHGQLDLIWLNLAQRYQAFGQSQRSAHAYDQVSRASAKYAQAQLAAGSASWAQYRKNIASGAPADSESQRELLQQAQKKLAVGLKKVSADLQKPTQAIVAAKLSLSRMAMLAGDLEKAESWLVDEPLPLVESIVVSNPDGNSIAVSPALLRSIFQTLFTVRSQLRDAAGAKSALEMMAAKLGDQQDLGKMFLSVVTDYVNRLLGSGSISREQFSTLSELIEPLKEEEEALTAANVLWLGESWSKLAEHAANEQLAQQCYAKAAAAYQLAMKRADFPKSSRPSAQIRRAELLRQAGQLAETIPIYEAMLKQNPGAFSVQIVAAETLEQLAIDASKPEDLVAVIQGPVEVSGSGESSIWGWGKLVTTLHAAGASDDDSKRDRLLKCQYHLANCQWLVAKSTSDTALRDEMLSDCRRSVDRLLATTSEDRQPWYGQLQELQKQIQRAD